MTQVIIPPAVIVPRNNKNNQSSAENAGKAVLTTVIDGRTELITRDGLTRVRASFPPSRAGKCSLTREREDARSGNRHNQTQLTTRSDGQVSTLTSIVALPDVTVSLTSLTEVIPGKQ